MTKDERDILRELRRDAIADVLAQLDWIAATIDTVLPSGAC
jgi:hypothetical protein